MTPDTGSPRADAQSDFARARRRRALALLSARLRREPDDVAMILPFEEVVEALGRAGERALGLQTIDLDSIVGTVDRTREFDRDFRPTTPRLRERWERIAAAQRRGEAMPPIDVYRVGDLHFVRDGHHRVSVARAQGLRHDRGVRDRGHHPDPAARAACGSAISRSRATSGCSPSACRCRPRPRARIQLSDEWRYAALAEGVEAWGFRYMQDRGELVTREQVAEAWYREEYVPVVELLREAGLLGARHRGRGVHARQRAALPAAAHPRLGRRGRRAPARGARAPGADGRGHARAPAARRARPARAAGPDVAARLSPSSTTTPSHGPELDRAGDGLAVARAVGRDRDAAVEAAPP